MHVQNKEGWVFIAIYCTQDRHVDDIQYSIVASGVITYSLKSTFVTNKFLAESQHYI